MNYFELLQIGSVTGTISAIFAALYRFFSTRDAQLRHHMILVRLSAAGGKGNLWDIVASGLSRTSKILEQLYGAPRSNERKFRDFLTRHSFRTSILFVTGYLLIGPLGLFVLGYFLYLMFASDKLDSSSLRAGWLLLAVALLVLTWTVSVFWNQWRRRFEDFKPQNRSIWNATLYSSLIAAAMLVSAVTSWKLATFISPKSLTIGVFFIVVVFLSIGTIVALALRFLISAVTSYDVFSPVALVGFLILTPIFFSHAMAGLLGTVGAMMFLLMAIVDPSFTFPELGIGISSSLAVAVLAYHQVVLVLVWFSWKKLRRTDIVPRSMWLLLLFILVGQFLIALILRTAGSGVVKDIGVEFEYGISLFGAFAGTLVSLLVFTPVLANGIPDGVSVAFTRYCLSQCLQGPSLLRVSFLVLADLLVALLTVILSFLIFVVGSSLAIFLVQTYGHTPGIEETISVVESSIQSFRRILLFPFHFVDMVNAGISDDFTRSISNVESTEFVTVLLWLLLFLYSVTTVYPTILNLGVLVCVFLVQFVVRISLALHDLLIERDDEGKSVGQWRSIALIGAVFGTVITVSAKILSTLKN